MKNILIVILLLFSSIFFVKGDFYKRIKAKFNIFQPDIPNIFPDRISNRLKLLNSGYPTITKSPSILFLGNSNTRRFNWNEHFEEKIYNRAVDGIGTYQMLEIVKNLKIQPKNILILCGINDVYYGVEEDLIINNLTDCIKILNKKTNSKIYIQSNFFVSKIRPESSRVNLKLKKLNSRLDSLTRHFDNVSFIDINSLLENDGFLNDDYTDDGVHLNLKGYFIWLNEIKKKI